MNRHKQPCGDCPLNSPEAQNNVIEAAIIRAYADPDAPKSNRAIAESLPQYIKADHKRVGRRLAELQATGALPQLEATKGLDGKNRRFGRSGTGSLPDNTPTPKGIARYIFDLLTIKGGFDPKQTTLLDPCAGTGPDGNRLNADWAAAGAKVIRFELREGTDFLEHQDKIEADIVIANPPFSGGQSIEFLQHIERLTGPDTPVVILGPAEMLFAAFRSSKRWQYMHRLTPRISSVIVLPRNGFESIVWLTCGLVLNVPGLPPCCTVPEPYLAPRRQKGPPRPPKFCHE